MTVSLEEPVQKQSLREPNTARRQQVVDAAAATFSRLGYHGASTRAIADALGIKVASLYFHFQSKDEALQEICLLGLERTLGYLSLALQNSASLAEQLRLFFRHQRDDFAAHADYVSVSIHEGRYLSPEAKARVGKHSAEFRRQVDAMFATAAARGELSPTVSPRQARFILVAMVRNISELYVGGGVRDFDTIMHGWIEAVIRGLVTEYRPPEAPPAA